MSARDTSAPRNCAFARANCPAGAEGGVAGQFYADLYLGLYNEAKGDVALAREYVRAAAASPYGESRDYMHALAVVHKAQRGW